MQALQSRVGDQILRPRSGRTPLQLKNSPATPVSADVLKIKPVQKWIGVCDDSNKENQRPIYAETPPTKMMEAMDTSLAEELSAIRKKMERMKIDKERTERKLKERDLVLEMHIKELENRGQIQKMLEIELDRIYRLNQLHTRSIRVSPIRSLREKEQEKKGAESPSQVNHILDFADEEEEAEDIEESVDENSPQKLSPSSWSNSKIVAGKTEK